MRTKQFRRFAAIALLMGVFIARPAYANYPVFDMTNSLILQQILAAIAAMNSTISGLLYNIGTAINQNGSKIVGTIQAASEVQQAAAVAKQQSARSYESGRDHEVPDSVCSESASGGAAEIAASSAAAKGSLRVGGAAKFENPQVGQAAGTPPVAGDVDASRTAKVHALYCDQDDYLSYGGTTACPSVSSSMPGADKRIDSLLYGAGPDGKIPDMTFSLAQTDVARLYEKNSIRRSVAGQLRKGEVDTPSGQRFVGLMNMLQASLSAAGDPQLQRIADSQPSPGTKDLLTESLGSPSAASYFNQTASQQAKSTGLMSQREFEAFEVGRRYANTAYQTDLQSMSGDNLTRELIRVISLNSWLLRGVKDDIERGNIIAGQKLASAVRQEYAPLLKEAQLGVSAAAARGTP